MGLMLSCSFCLQHRHILMEKALSIERKNVVPIPISDLLLNIYRQCSRPRPTPRSTSLSKETLC